MSSGRYYWEIKILKLSKENNFINDLYIGIGRKKFGLEEKPKDSNKFCGYMC